LQVFLAYPPIKEHEQIFVSIDYQGITGGPGLTTGVYSAVGVTAWVDERVGRGVAESAGCGVGLDGGVLVGGAGLG